MTTSPEQKPSLSVQFRAAAEMLAAHQGAEAPNPRTRNFLHSLGFWPASADAVRRQHHVRMLNFAAGLDRFFRLDSPFAPGARFCGGMDAGTDFRPAGNYAGRGFDLGHALLTCIGEAAEYSAMYRRTGDARLQGTTVAGRSLVSGGSILVEASKVLRGQHPDAAQPSSTGYAAGPSFDAAVESAFLECVERDAIARWSLGETRPVEIVPDDHVLAMLEAVGRAPARPVLFADMSPTDPLAHSVVAVSTDQMIGTALGFGSAFSRQDACRKALLELCQGEIGLLMIARKQREVGTNSLSPKETDALSRAEAYQPGTGLLDFRTGSDRAATSPKDFATTTTFAGEKGVDILACDITVRGEDLPVAKVFVTGLFDAATLSGQNGLPSLL